MYAKFDQSYYGHGEPLLNAIEFLQHAPITVIDCSRQNESLKSATVDVRIDFECKENVPANTSAVCLIIHDRIVEYSPLTNVVRQTNIACVYKLLLLLLLILLLLLLRILLLF